MNDERVEVEVEEAVENHARRLGIDPFKHKEFLWIAEESLLADVPEPWGKYVSETGEIYYYNNNTGETSYENPVDDYFRNMFEKLISRRAKMVKRHQDREAAFNYKEIRPSAGKDHSNNMHPQCGQKNVHLNDRQSTTSYTVQNRKKICSNCRKFRRELSNEKARYRDKKAGWKESETRLKRIAARKIRALKKQKETEILQYQEELSKSNDLKDQVEELQEQLEQVTVVAEQQIKSSASLTKQRDTFKLEIESLRLCLEQARERELDLQTDITRLKEKVEPISKKSDTECFHQIQMLNHALEIENVELKRILESKRREINYLSMRNKHLEEEVITKIEFQKLQNSSFKLHECSRSRREHFENRVAEAKLNLTTSLSDTENETGSKRENYYKHKMNAMSESVESERAHVIEIMKDYYMRRQSDRNILSEATNLGQIP